MSWVVVLQSYPMVFGTFDSPDDADTWAQWTVDEVVGFAPYAIVPYWERCSPDASPTRYCCILCSGHGEIHYRYHSEFCDLCSATGALHYDLPILVCPLCGRWSHAADRCQFDGRPRLETVTCEKADSHRHDRMERYARG